jgi:hypothetical protein
MTTDELHDSCTPIITNEDVGRYYAVQNPDDPGNLVSLEPSDPAYPCGLVAKSLFNDTFKITKDGVEIPQNMNGIAWETDVDAKFKNLPPDQMYTKQWYNVEEENFIVWMRVAGLSSFRKLYAKIEQPLTPG